MKDLNGEELEVGTIYHILGSGNRLVICKYSHETASSFVFKPITYRINKVGESSLYTWKRVIYKYWSTNILMNSLPVIKVSQEVLDKYQIS